MLTNIDGKALFNAVLLLYVLGFVLPRPLIADGKYKMRLMFVQGCDTCNKYH